MPKSVRGVMREFKSGALHSGTRRGPVVTKPKQAIAIALSEQRQMHPKMVERAKQVKASHAHLTQNVPGFAALSGREQIKATHAHATKTLGKRYR